ncbi:serine/threonine-protein kinase [Rugosimonospora acidiphila]|uniref:non-specific serine/threonine protein kinase n=1 Tax=Rugosimonospora acidiphila TaxID=556531 RepID=A0ABP9SVE5_9ACTN
MTSAPPCLRPGCTGHYAADGYCDECGHKAPVGAAASAGSPSGAATPAGSPTGGAAPAGSRGGMTSAATLGGGAPTGAGLAGVSTGTGRSSRSRTAGRGRLGANLVVVPPVPLRDPATAVQSDPAVPESQRYCPKCGEPVGRGRNGQPGRVEGFCPRDGARYSFKPKLRPGDLIDGRYEILGALAHGGLGWIYLARDRNISEAGTDRWVVLKGLINTGDPDAMAAAVAERRFLVEVDHPNIVKIHDFAQHPDPDTGENVGYIVMEYVGGRSLRDLALNNRGPDGTRVPLPLAQVLAYGIEVLPALGYLHDRGLLFCDFKPDNVIHAEEQLKLIDLGAVRRMGDDVSALYGTPGYQAPENELATVGPSIGSDLYTVGRSLAVLSFDFSGFSTRYASSLPPAETVPLLAAQESYHRLLRRATNTDPARRFPSAGEMAEQLTGVLREVLSAEDGIPRPAASGQFTPERRAFGVPHESAAARLDGLEVVAALPLPLVDPADPAAGFLATLSGGDPASTVAALETAPVTSLELTFRLVRARLEAGDLAGARAALPAAEPEAYDWRLDWYAGLLALSDPAAEPTTAWDLFDKVYDALPGEPAAQLATAAAGELAGDLAAAARLYERVWRVDHGFVSAAFGLARTRLAAGDRAGARAIYDEIPDSSSHHVAAQIAAVRVHLDQEPVGLAEADLLDASTRLERLRLDKQRRETLSVEVFRTALAWVIRGSGTGAGVPGQAAAAGRAPNGGGQRTVPAQRTATAGRILGQVLSERDVRLGLERSYRALASLEPDRGARHALVDLANSVRPRTVV